MILIVDDHEDTRGMLDHILKWDSLDSTGVESGPKALEYLQNNRPSLIILDYNMPEMDGMEVLRRLKADEKLRSIPVLIFSAFGDEVKAQALEGGASGYVQKGSLDWLVLGTQIRAIIGRAA